MMRVLVVGLTATVGGLERIVMDYCEQIDPKRIQFDFLSRFPDCVMADRIRARGGELYTVTRRSRNPIRFYREIRSFFTQHGGQYQVLWDNECMLNDVTPLVYAKRAGIPCRIYHSHNSQNMDPSLKGRLQEILHRWHRRRLDHMATALWACSEDAAQWAGRKLPYTIIPNAVRTEDFVFRPEARAACRAELGMEHCYVIGHTGRLQYQKNQSFLLEAFARLWRLEPDSRLLLVGQGPDERLLRQKARTLGVESAVRFLGYREDIPRLLQAMDVFALPSRFEGLSISALEAQASGLPCLIADTVSSKTGVTAGAQFLPIDDPQRWAEALQRLKERRGNRDQTQALMDAGYDLSAVAEKLTERFEQMAADPGRKVILSVPSSVAYAHALSKAREDVEAFAVAQGYLPLALRSADSAHGNRLRQLGMLAQCMGDWLSLFHRLRSGDAVLMQYPHLPLKSAPLARYCILLLRRWKHCRFTALIHDLDSLREIGGSPAVYSDRKLLPVMDAIICHNTAMKEWLTSQGLPAQRITELKLFDYVTDAPIPVRTREASVTVAGNLSEEKCGYLYRLLEQAPPPYRLHLYGTSFMGQATGNVVYHGVVPAQELPAVLEGAYGLVWDGPSLSTCEGRYGDYLKLNNPHKLSLYLAAGMPVIVWKESAQVRFVQENGVGFAISSLDEIAQCLDEISCTRYDRMAQNARAIGAQARRGAYLENALRAVKTIVSKD